MRRCGGRPGPKAAAGGVLPCSSRMREPSAADASFDCDTVRGSRLPVEYRRAKKQGPDDRALRVQR
jgi:hypothetical protein